MRRFTLKRILLALAALLVLSGAAAALCWKPLLIEWHKREIVRLDPTGVRGSLNGYITPLGIVEFQAEPEAIPMLYRLSQSLWDWPDDWYFRMTDAVKVNAHVERLRVLGYLEKAEFLVGAWAFNRNVSTLPECPITESSAVFGTWALERIAEPDQVALGGTTRLVPMTAKHCGQLFVWDVPSRIPLWKAFVDRHNAEEVAGRKRR